MVTQHSERKGGKLASIFTLDSLKSLSFHLSIHCASKAFLLSILLFPALLLLLVACGDTATLSPTTTVPAAQTPTSNPTPTPTPGPSIQPENNLGQALAKIPLRFADKPIEFADYSAFRAATGLEDARGLEGIAKLDRETRRRWFEGGVFWHEDLKDSPDTLNELVGLDIYDLDLGIWTRGPEVQERSFVLFKGPFDEQDIQDNLLGLDYQEQSYQGIRYFGLHEDFAASIRHPLRLASLPINRIAFVEDWLLAAPATGNLEDLIDVNVQDGPGLLSNEAHRTLAEVAGNGLIGGVLVTPEWITENWNTRVSVGPADRLDRYTQEPERWENLSPYSLALFGYRVQEGKEETLIALFYPDPSAAQNDVDTLLHRWNSFYYEPFGPIWTPETETKATRSCSSLSASTIQSTDASVLLASCQVIRSQEPDDRVKGAGLWSYLHLTTQLEFLAPSIAELKQTAESR
jgi:hypothetical protein